MFEKRFYKWILRRMKKKIEREYLPKKERKQLEKRYRSMKKELIKSTNTELACYFIAMLALEREPISPENIFNIGQACFIDAKSFDESYRKLANKIEKKREEVRNLDERQAILQFVSHYTEHLAKQESFLDEYIQVYMKLTGAVRENECNIFRLGFYSIILYSLIF